MVICMQPACLRCLCVDTPLEETVLPPMATEAIWNNRQIRNPEKTAKKTGLGSVQEGFAGELFPPRLVVNVMRLQLGCYASREV